MDRRLVTRWLIPCLCGFAAFAGLAAGAPTARACCGEIVQTEILSFSADGRQALAERIVENICMPGRQVAGLVVLDTTTGEELEQIETTAAEVERVTSAATAARELDELPFEQETFGSSPARARAARAARAAVEARRSAFRADHRERFPLRAAAASKQELRWRQLAADRRVLEVQSSGGRWTAVLERELEASAPDAVAPSIWVVPGAGHALVAEDGWFGGGVNAIDLATGDRTDAERPQIAALRTQLRALMRASAD